jgi:hemerythrin-like metal-binding protein
MKKKITADPYLWKREYELDNERFDNQTRKFLEIINLMKEMVALGVDDDRMAGIFFSLTHYFERYMIQEEIYLKGLRYTDIEPHMRSHREFIDRIIVFRKGFEKGDKDFHIDMYEYLEQWFDDHIMVDDRKVAHFINGQLS